MSDYKNKSSKVGEWLRWTFGLAMLEPSDVSDCFVFSLMSVIPTNQKLIKFADYLTDNYIDEYSLFPPSIWASATETERTTNACESFHSKFNSYFYNAHPNIFLFIDVLKNIQIDTYVKMNSVKTPHEIKNKLYLRKKLFFKDKITLYNSKTITKFEFVKLVSYYLKK